MSPTQELIACIRIEEKGALWQQKNRTTKKKSSVEDPRKSPEKNKKKEPLEYLK